jgi:signal transduction histidine kinase
VLREALSNVVRHAQATSVEVTVRAISGGELVATVTDDGVGVTAPARPGGRGIDNMARRAESLGGEARVDPGPARKGTTVTWRVPLVAAAG